MAERYNKKAFCYEKEIFQMKKNKANLINWIFYAITLVIIYFSSAHLFLHQAVGDYHSDLKSHIRIALKEQSYSLQKYIFRFLYSLTGDVVPIVIFLSIVIMLTPLAVSWLFKVMDRTQNVSLLNIWIYRWGGVFLCFVGALVLPRIYPWYNFYTFSINCWHNQTTNEMRLVFLFCVGLYFMIDLRYLKDDKLNWRLMLLYSLVLAADTWLKPSMFIGWAPVMAIWLLVDFFTNPKTGKNFLRMVAFALTVVPSLMVIGYQYLFLYGQDSDVGVGFYYNLDLQMQAIRTALFLICPLIVLSYNLRRLDRSGNRTERRQVRQVIVLWIFEWLYASCLNETGNRAGAGNFGWGIRIANFVVFATVYRMFAQNCAVQWRKHKRGEKAEHADILYMVIIILCWSWQLFCGIRYFNSLVHGGVYWV